MRRFVMGAVFGAAVTWFYIYQYADWHDWANGKLNTVGSKYRGDETHREADNVSR